MEQLYKIFNILNEGELFVVPVLLILLLLLKRRIKNIGELLVSYNYLKLFLITLSFLITIIQLTYLLSKNNGEFISFQYRISGPYSWSYYFLFVMSFMLLILLCFKRWRMNPWFAFVVFIFSYAGLWMERIVIFITSLYRDYLPSTWSVSYNITDPIVSSFAFSTVLFLIYISGKSKFLTKAKS